MKSLRVAILLMFVLALSSFQPYATVYGDSEMVVLLEADNAVRAYDLATGSLITGFQGDSSTEIVNVYANSEVIIAVEGNGRVIGLKDIGAGWTFFHLYPWYPFYGGGVGTPVSVVYWDSDMVILQEDDSAVRVYPLTSYAAPITGFQGDSSTEIVNVYANSEVIIAVEGNGRVIGLKDTGAGWTFFHLYPWYPFYGGGVGTPVSVVYWDSDMVILQESDNAVRVYPLTSYAAAIAGFQGDPSTEIVNVYANSEVIIAVEGNGRVIGLKDTGAGWSFFHLYPWYPFYGGGVGTPVSVVYWDSDMVILQESDNAVRVYPLTSYAAAIAGFQGSEEIVRVYANSGKIIAVEADGKVIGIAEETGWGSYTNFWYPYYGTGTFVSVVYIGFSVACDDVWVTPKNLNVDKKAEHSFKIHVRPSAAMGVSVGDVAKVYVDVDKNGTFDEDEGYQSIVSSTDVDGAAIDIAIKVYMGADLQDNDPTVAIYSIKGIPIIYADYSKIEDLQINTFSNRNEGKGAKK